MRDFEWLEHAGQHLPAPPTNGRPAAPERHRPGLGLLASAVLVGAQWSWLRGSIYPWYASWAVQVLDHLLYGLAGVYQPLTTTCWARTRAVRMWPYQSIKGIRTGVLLGTLSTLVMLPIAVTPGRIGGLFQGLGG